MEQADPDQYDGLIRPSLITDLRRILDQYPDDGQILKELVQNAEDAGASRVDFLYDEQQYGRTRLHHPDLQQHQGAALYAYNDAMFTGADWKGIRMYNDSVKENDPLKVGRFGLGFKSVLHLTDLPSVLSNDRIFMIDPTETYFTNDDGDRATGCRWLLQDGKSDMAKIPDQFDPYKGVLGSTEDDFERGHFPGTLFRFPLRHKPSKLSDLIYDHHKVEALFASFETEAPLLLVFLKNVQCVRIYTRKREPLEMAWLRFEVKVSERSRARMTKSRLDFVNKVRDVGKKKSKLECFSESYLLDLEVIKHDGLDQTVQQYSFLVTETYAGKQVAMEFTRLEQDMDPTYIPIVGIAAAIGQSTQPEQASTHTDGHVFCFLPLPSEQSSSTGLPVHVNGYFAVSQNRRHLKWRTMGQETTTDKCVVWNEVLLGKALPVAYIQFILNAIKIFDAEPTRLTAADIYNFLPDMDAVDEKWRKIILEPVFTGLLESKIFYSVLKPKQWHALRDVVVDDLNEDELIRQDLLYILDQAKINVVSLPCHVIKAMRNYSYDYKTITPSLILSTLRDLGPSAYRHCSRETKLRVLNHIINVKVDCNLDEIELLPLANGTFTSFQQYAVEKIYMTTKDIPQNLFPGMEKHILDDNLPKQLLKLLRMPTGNQYQLESLTTESAAKLIRATIPDTWSAGVTCPLAGTPPGEWLKRIWTYLRLQHSEDNTASGHSASSLRLYSDGLPILPLNQNGTKVALLQRPARVVLRRHHEDSLPAEVAEVLVCLGVVVMDELPAYLSHPAVIDNFVRRPVVGDVLEAIATANPDGLPQSVIDMIVSRKDSEKDHFVDFIKTYEHLRNHTAAACIKLLPVFRTTSSTFDSPSGVGVATDMHKIPISVMDTFLDASDVQTRECLQRLDVRYLKPATVMLQYVLPNLQQEQDEERMQTVIDYIFDNFYEFIRDEPELQEALSKLKFVRTQSSSVMVSNVFDPHVPFLRELFVDEDVFPVNAADKHLVFLRILGMTNIDGIRSIHVVECIRKTQDLAAIGSGQEKGHKLLELFSKTPSILDQIHDGLTVKSWAGRYKWVPVLYPKPSNFPDSLPWPSQGNVIVHPNVVKSQNFINVSGSVQETIGGEASTEVMEKFGWDDKPEYETVTSQLKNLIQFYNLGDKLKFTALVIQTIGHLLQVHPSKFLREWIDEKWVWHGDGFTTQNTILLCAPKFDLRPFYYQLPDEMSKFIGVLRTEGGLIEQCGCQEYISILHKIKSDHERHLGSSSYNRHLSLTIEILKYLKHHRHELDVAQEAAILFPVQTPTDDTEYLQLRPAAECTYCDQDYDDELIDPEEELHFIHADVPAETAEILGVPALVSRLFADEDFTITGCGQAEPLTVRLHNLLQGYRDGLAVVKELVQNADDAGASQVKFVYDERENKDWTRHLIDEGMAECQGPALWAYNDAEFTEVDFANITKLGGATKAQEADKIGQFGLGFNAVYNLTDVPSFVSNNSVVIFDPHLKFLGKAIRDRSHPGIRINLGKRRRALSRFKDQFHPFQDVCGCTIFGDDSETSNFKGTLFRFPLRTKQQALCSKISETCYDKNKIIELIRVLEDNSHNMLLFTQSVCQISVEHIPKEGDPCHPIKLLNIAKDVKRVLQDFPEDTNNVCDTVRMDQGEDEGSKQSSRVLKTLKASKDYLEIVKHQSYELTAIAPNCTFILKTFVHKQSTLSKRILSLKPKVANASESKLWLISTCCGQHQSLDMAIQDTENMRMIPTASIAIHVVQIENNITPIELTEDSSKDSGQAFCFLPLPIHTGLPVHVNAPVFLDPSRKTITSLTTDDTTPTWQMRWNDALFDDAVLQAYIQALIHLTTALPESFSITTIWPTSAVPNSVFEALQVKFFQNVEKHLIPFATNGGVSATTANTTLLDIDFGEEHIREIALQVMNEFHPGHQHICLNNDIMKLLNMHQRCLVKRIYYSSKRFYEEILLPNINDCDVSHRNKLIAHGLQLSDIEQLFAGSACIPCSPDGLVLRTPPEMVHPNSRIGNLYTPEESYFPMSGEFSRAHILKVLTKLGMKEIYLTWNDIVERADALAKHHHEHASELPHYNRFQLLWTITSEMILEANSIEIDDTMAKLQSIKCLPVAKKPLDFPLEWREGSGLQCPKETYPHNLKYLVSCSKFIISLGEVPLPILKHLGVEGKKPEYDDFIEQLDQVLETDNFGNSYDCQSCIENIYDYLQNNIHKEDWKYLCNNLLKRKCILIDDMFVKPRFVAKHGTKSVTCKPFLFELPRRYSKIYETLMDTLKIRPQFDAKDYVHSIQLLKDQSSGMPLSDADIDKCVLLLQGLSSSGAKNYNANDVFVPDTKGILQSAQSLHLNDGSECEGSDSVMFTHTKVSRDIAIQLGIKTTREEVIARNSVSMGKPFGQKVKLKSRIRSILHSYPCDKEILKELVQNADDAGATEIHFILDHRKHPTKRVFSETWEQLQGPALCVYNNKPFTEADIDGIQNLEEGTKSKDPATTGQYGIGFSSMYHLTDVPSFLTCGEEVEMTLCALDPHGFYTPGATDMQPGIRYINMDEVRGVSPDVFPGYLEDIFPINNATMFRFPLRNGIMAKSSLICQDEMTIERMENILHGFKSELSIMLLFLNNINTIKISTIHKKHLCKTYEVTATMSDHDQKKFDRWVSLKDGSISSLRENTMAIDNCSNMAITITKMIKDTCSLEETWLVGLSFGFKDPSTIPVSIVDAYTQGTLRLAPIGGAAVMIGGGQPEVTGRLFCGLPTPSKTGLAVHINGHFALGFDNRRQLWSHSDGSYQKEWNNLLLTTVIAEAYCDILRCSRAIAIPRMEFALDMSLDEDPDKINSYLYVYLQRFPVLRDQCHEYEILLKSVLKDIAQERLLPSVSIQECNSSNSSNSRPVLRTQQLVIHWVAPIGDYEGKFKAVFAIVDKKKSEMLWESKNKLLECLLRCGCKLVSPYEYSERVYHSFKSAGCDVANVSPMSVIHLLKSCTESGVCALGCNIPAPVKNTTLRDTDTIKILFRYCSLDDNFEDEIDGLPLLVTSDEVLKVFSNDIVVFHSVHGKQILSCRPDIFLHLSLKNYITTISNYIGDFTIATIARYIEFQLQNTTYKTGNVSIPQDRFIKGWLQKVWKFIEIQYKNTETPPIGNEFLKALDDWCLIPTYKSNKEHVTPVGKAHTVVCYHKESPYLQAVLEKLGVIKLQPFFCVNDALQSICASLTKPLLILNILYGVFSKDGFILTINEDECKAIFDYMVKHFRVFHPDAIMKLRYLRIYQTTDTGNTSLCDCNAYLYPPKAPMDGVSVSRAKVGIVFLRRAKTDEENHFYKFIDCRPIEEEYLYCRVIFQMIDLLNVNELMAHLRYIYTEFVDVDGEESPILTRLRHTPIIKTTDGELHKASEVFDPRVKLFQYFSNEDIGIVLLPTPTDAYFSRHNDKWVGLMKSIGMVTKVQAKKYVELAKHVAHMSSNIHPQTKKRVRKLSEVLLDHLFRHMSVDERNEILPSIRDIPCIAPHSVTSLHNRAAQQFGDRDSAGELKYISFASSISVTYSDESWSACQLVPAYADPMNNLYRSKEVNECMAILHMKSAPDASDIPSHVHNLNVNMQALCSSTKEFRDLYNKVFINIYIYLKKLKSLASLNNAKLVLVETVGRCVCAKETVCTLKDDEQIKPYLYRVPPEFGAYHDLFKRLGASEEVTPLQYARIFGHIKENIGDNTMDPNNIRRCKKAFIGLFETLKKHPEKAGDIVELFLPCGDRDNGLTLKLASTLVYNDAPAFYKRAGDHGLQYMIDVRRFGLNPDQGEEFMRLLNNTCRPRFLSTVLKETIHESTIVQSQKCPLALSLERKIRSQPFIDAVVRLAKHNLRKRCSENSSELIYEIPEKLSVLQILSHVKVETHLWLNKQTIVGSEQTRVCFPQHCTSAFTDDTWIIYITKQYTEESHELLLPFAECIDNILGNILTESFVFLFLLLQCPLEELDTKLNALNVRPNAAIQTSSDATLVPELGTPVDEDRFTIIPGATYFDEEEYVGYRDDHTHPLVYAIVHGNAEPSGDDKYYIIDFGGQKHKIVSSRYLYKFQQ